MLGWTVWGLTGGRDKRFSTLLQNVQIGSGKHKLPIHWVLGTACLVSKGLATQKAGCRGRQQSVPAAGKPSNCIT